MNTKGIKFLAVLAVLAMAFAAFAVLANAETNDAEYTAEVTDESNNSIKFKFNPAAADAYGIAYGDVQAITAELDEATGTIKLKGDLYDVKGTPSEAKIADLYTGGLPANYGIVFQVYNLKENASKIQISGGDEGTVTGTSEPNYKALKDAALSEKSFTVTIKYDGTHSKIYTIDYSELIKAQVDSKKYFTVQDAIKAASSGKTVQIINDTTPKGNIVIDKLITLSSDANNVKKVTGAIKYDAAALLTATETSTGSVTVQNLKIETNSVLGWDKAGASQAGGNLKLSLIWKNCDIKMTGQEALDGGCPTIGVYGPKVNFEVSGCTFVNAYDEEAGAGLAIYYYNLHDDGASVLKVTDCKFSGYARCVVMNLPGNVEIKNNEVKKGVGESNEFNFFVQLATTTGTHLVNNAQIVVTGNEFADTLTPISAKPMKYVNFHGNGTYVETFNIKSATIDGEAYLQSNAKIAVAATCTLAVNGLTTEATSVIQNAGTITIVGDIVNAGTITNTAKINFNGEYTKSGDGAFDNTNESAIIVCQEAYQYSLLKTALGASAGVIKVAGASPTDTPITPVEVAAVDGKIDADADKKVVVATGTVKEAAAKADQSIIITTVADNAVLDVSSSNSEISFIGDMTDKTVTVKTATSTIKVEGVSGTITFSSGSIISKVAPWSGGTIYLKNGDVLKLSGEISDDVAIDYEGTTGTATVVIEEGADKALTIDNAKTLTIKSASINVQVEGILDGTGTLDMNKGGVLLVKGTVSPAITGKAVITVEGTITGNVTTTKAMTVSSTGVVSGAINIEGALTVNGKITGGVTTKNVVNVYGKAAGAFDLSNANASLVIYQDAHVNAASVTASADMKKVSGKDANGGTWSYDANTLTIKDFNGAYNFGIKDTVANKTMGELILTIVASGDSKITCVLPEISASFQCFPSVTLIKTIQGSGSLDIEMDISKADETAMEAGIAVIGDMEPTSLELSAVDVNVKIKGNNATWDSEKIRVAGLYVTDIEMNDSTLMVDVLSNQTADLVFGIICDSMDLSKSNIESVSAGFGIYSEDLTVGANYVVKLKNTSNIIAGGKFVGMVVKDTNGEAKKAIDLSAKSALVVTNGFEVCGNVELAQNSGIAAEKFFIEEGTLTNNATVAISGDSVIKKGAEIVNKSNFMNTGSLNVYGKLNNQAGTFTNEGTITVFAKEFAAAADRDATFSTAADTTKISATAAELKSITINKIGKVTNGTLEITKATLSFTYKTGEGGGATDADFKNLDGFTGTLKPVQSSSGKDYVLSLSNGTATVQLTYDTSKTGEELGKRFSLTVSGTIAKNVGTDKFSVIMPSGADKTVGHTVAIEDYIVNASAENTYLKVTGGKMVNNGTVAFYGVDAQPEFVKADAEYEGPVTIGAQTVTINGTFTGDLTSKGAVIVDNGTFKGKIDAAGNVTVGNGDADTNKGKVEGEIVSKKAVAVGAKASIEGPVKAGTTLTSKGNIKGEVTAKDNVVLKNLEGDIVVDKNGDYSVTITGKVNGTLTYNSAAKAKVPAEGETVDPTTYPVVMTIDADLDATTAAALVIKLNKAVDATETEAVKKGYFSIEDDGVAELKAGNNVNITMKVGKLFFPQNINMPVRYAFVFEADTIIEVASVATIDFSNAALKVSKDATSNFVTGTTPVTEYGIVKAIMSFMIESGAYTIYSGVTYALTECEENSNLVVELDATLTDNVSVKKGVNVIVSDKVTLDFDIYGMEMDEGAMITLMGTGKVVFKKTGENLHPGDDTKDYEFYTISGTIVYGENSVEFADVRFTEESVVAGVAATSTSGAKIGTNLQYNEGIVTVSEGTGTGTIVLENGAYFLTKDDAATGKDEKKTLVYAKFIVGTDAVFDAVDIVDAFAKVIYKTEGEELVVDRIVLMPTIVGVEGVLNLNAAKTYVKGAYGGLGVVTLAAGKELILDASAAKAEGEVTVPANVSVTIVDTTEDKNGYHFQFVAPKDNDTLTLKATTYKVAGETVPVMTISGHIGVGIVTATTEAVVNGLLMEKESTLIGDEVYIIGETTVNGSIYAKEMYMKDGATSDFAKLIYEVTYEDQDYTVYTVFDNIDFEEISDITIAGDKDKYKLSDLTKKDAGAKIDLSGTDVNITVAEDKVLIVDQILIIGTPATEIGAEGSSISGKVVIYNTNYIVAYADVDLLLADIEGAYVHGAPVVTDKKDAVFSILTIEDVLYASIIAVEKTMAGDNIVAGVKLAAADKGIVPQIEGYVFTNWNNLDEDKDSCVGETNAYAGAKAVLVNVTVKFVEGVSYYCDGVEFAIYDTPTKVEYNSVFTAKINNTAKYQGTPLINGKNSFIVTDDVTLTATGVTPIPEPTPEPVEENTGLSLTDILLIVLVILIAIMVVILVLRLNRS